MSVAERSTAADRSLVYLLAYLRALEQRVRGAVERRRATDPEPQDAFRGLYLSEDHVERLLADPHRSWAPSRGGPRVDRDGDGKPADPQDTDIRLVRLARRFDLDEMGVDVLVIAMAPDLDARYEQLYGYLHDDVTRRRASIGLALELTGMSAAWPDAREWFGARGVLSGAGLLHVEEQDRPFLTRSLRVPDRITGFLLGSDEPDPAVAGLIEEPVPVGGPEAVQLGRAIAEGTPLCYLRQVPGTSGRALGAGAAAAAGRGALVVDLSRLTPNDRPQDVARLVAMEAALREAILVVGPVEVLLKEPSTEGIRAFAETGVPTVLTGSGGWDPSWSSKPPLPVEVTAITPQARASLWRAELDGGVQSGLDPAAATAQFRLDPEQVRRAARLARLQASYEGRPVSEADLRAGVRGQNAVALERLAYRVRPQATWDDLVLPPEADGALREIALWSRHRELVLDGWGMRRGLRAQGTTALFVGPSGTGKTLAAEVLASDLGLDLYTIDLATVVDKYIGETEKNLDRIFAEAEGANALLFFDEADALFGKRSEVKDAHDRYANIEVAYLLQRMERFDGIAIMATNLRANLDDAFTRRIDTIIEFPMPEQEHRLLLWERSLPSTLPRDPDVDLAFMAQAFEIPGGNIRNIALAAAYLAAENGRSVAMADVIRSTAREFRKLGRLLYPSEFGPYYGLLG